MTPSDLVQLLMELGATKKMDALIIAERPSAREKLDEFAELRGWNKQKLIGWSESADFAEWYAEQTWK